MICEKAAVFFVPSAQVSEQHAKPQTSSRIETSVFSPRFAPSDAVFRRFRGAEPFRRPIVVLGAAYCAERCYSAKQQRKYRALHAVDSRRNRPPFPPESPKSPSMRQRRRAFS